MEITIRRNKKITSLIREMSIGDKLILRNAKRLSVVNICSREKRVNGSIYTTTAKGLKNAVMITRIG
jgi:hypothetical protein